jgi:AraC family transcriptional regulator, regulatory protein of adaptative response / methylated-DNA-[protein]-cysteine methyltransferase
MTDQLINYNRIAKAIEFITKNFKSQPSLDEIASHIHLSPFHFQRLFLQWAGVSPKKFLQFITVSYAKSLLKAENATLFNVSFETGLSGSSRLHDLFTTIEGMTPAEYKNEGENLSINYNFSESPFGKIIVASTLKGICHLAFIEDETNGLSVLKEKFPKANYTHSTNLNQQHATAIFSQDWSNLEKIKLHLKGTDFQLKVWETLLKIPTGHLASYKNVAEKINKPTASRAVGTAIGDNPIAFLIPCHRVIQSTGGLGGYMWGETRKKIILAWEASALSSNKITEEL